MGTATGRHVKNFVANVGSNEKVSQFEHKFFQVILHNFISTLRHSIAIDQLHKGSPSSEQALLGDATNSSLAPKLHQRK